MLDTAIGRLRAIGLLEGTSFLILLGVAMPLKRLAGMPGAVTLVGWIHGVLFILFCAALAHAAISSRWRGARVGQLFIASLLPFGTFLVDGSLKREDLTRRSQSGEPRS